jgi:hypothetical protein
MRQYHSKKGSPSQLDESRSKLFFSCHKGIKGLDFDLARWPDFSRPFSRSSRGLRNSPSYGRLKHARQPAKRMPEILEERFGRAKSGLMLAPAKTQALAISEIVIVPRFRLLTIEVGAAQAENSGIL